MFANMSRVAKLEKQLEDMRESFNLKDKYQEYAALINEYEGHKAVVRLGWNSCKIEIHVDTEKHYYILNTEEEIKSFLYDLENEE